jgi:microcystin-dependent protein
MAKGVAAWSQTAANNATGDSTINWAEGMAPSAVNDSARAMMASVAYWRDDITGAITTGGTSTAYTVTSYQSFASLSALNGQMIAFTPHATNGGTTTLNVDSLTAMPLRSSPSVELPAGTLIQGTPYVAVYNSSDAVFYLQNFFGSPYSIPIGAGVDFWGTTTPNSSFVFAYGQAISRSTYSALFAMFSTTYGSGDGSTTFNIPDMRGRVVAGKGDMGGSDAARLTASYFGASGTSLGSTGGSQSHTLDSTQMPSHTHTATDSGHTHVQHPNTVYQANGAIVSGGTGTGLNPVVGTVTGTGTANITNSNTGGGLAHNNVQPTIIANYILRII